MNDDDPKPGVVIDVTPDPETQPASDNERSEQAEAPPPAKSARSGSARAALVLALLALAGLVAAGLFGYRYWDQIQQDLASIDIRLQDSARSQQQLAGSLNDATSALRAQQDALSGQEDMLARQRLAVDEARAAFQSQEQRLADENLRLQEREAELRAAVADVHRRVGRSGTQWIIAETEYLLQIASHRLILARDTETARIALELADQRLRDTKDPGWTGVREQIARDIAALSAFQAPDSAGMSARLSALIAQVPQLNIASATIGPERTLPERKAHAPGERNWETLLDDLWAGFKDSVRIRERDQPVQAMLAPEHQFFLYENLRLNLEAARLGLARGDQALFRDNLDTASAWLDKYFDPTDGTTGSMRGAIAELRAVQIRPEVPDVSQSLRALRVRQELMEEVAPGGDETR